MRYLIRHLDWGWLVDEEVPAVWEVPDIKLGTSSEIRGHRRTRRPQKITVRHARRFKTYEEADAVIHTWPKYKDRGSPQDRMVIEGVPK